MSLGAPTNQGMCTLSSDWAPSTSTRSPGRRSTSSWEPLPQTHNRWCMSRGTCRGQTVLLFDQLLHLTNEPYITSGLAMLPPDQTYSAPHSTGSQQRESMAAHHYSPLFFTSVLALLSPLLALHIENLERLNVNLDEIINIPSDRPLPDEAGGTGQNRAGDPQQEQGRSGWPKDCSELPASSPSGIYIIQPTGQQTIVVYCEMSKDDGGWTVIQRNHRDTPVSWDESWSTYKHGFGNVHTEFWLGTEYIHQITRQKVYQVRFVIWDASNNMKFADYNLFSVGDESQGYQLRLGAHSGTAEDAMASKGTTTMHDNMKFSAKDRDQDTSSGNCASSSGGAWWYSACYSVRLNFKGAMTWGNLGSCRASAILIKPTSYC